MESKVRKLCITQGFTLGVKGLTNSTTVKYCLTAFQWMFTQSEKLETFVQVVELFESWQLTAAFEFRYLGEVLALENFNAEIAQLVKRLWPPISNHRPEEVTCWFSRVMACQVWCGLIVLFLPRAWNFSTRSWTAFVWRGWLTTVSRWAIKCFPIDLDMIGVHIATFLTKTAPRKMFPSMTLRSPEILKVLTSPF